jgi:hypothetical protein
VIATISNGGAAIKTALAVQGADHQTTRSSR